MLGRGLGLTPEQVATITDDMSDDAIHQLAWTTRTEGWGEIIEGEGDVLIWVQEPPLRIGKRKEGNRKRFQANGTLADVRGYVTFWGEDYELIRKAGYEPSQITPENGVLVMVSSEGKLLQVQTTTGAWLDHARAKVIGLQETYGV